MGSTQKLHGALCVGTTSSNACDHTWENPHASMTGMSVRKPLKHDVAELDLLLQYKKHAGKPMRENPF